MLVDAPRNALDADPYASGWLDLTEPGPETHKLLTIQRFQVWDDGTVDDINVRTVQSNEWCEAVGASEGAEVPLPLDLVDMGLPEGLTGTVLSIQQCPQPPPGPGRLVLTTVNHLNRDVIELDLRGLDGKLETLRPTGNHKFYSVTRNAWLSAAELVEGEQLDGVAGLVTVERKRTLPGTHRVYNLTVQGEHLYRVATSGVLVHNQGCGSIGRMTPDQQALKELVDEATLGGRKPLSVHDAETVLDWADEVNYPGWRAGPGDVAGDHWIGPHIHLPGAGRHGHVPVAPGVRRLINPNLH